jgi:hypothetical protein
MQLLPDAAAPSLRFVWRSYQFPEVPMGMPDNAEFTDEDDKVVDASQVTMADQPIILPTPKASAPPSARLSLRKEDGVVKGFEYTCTCGERHYFVCE